MSVFFASFLMQLCSLEARYGEYSLWYYKESLLKSGREDSYNLEFFYFFFNISFCCNYHNVAKTEGENRAGGQLA